jgi:hypothetical protein
MRLMGGVSGATSDVAWLKYEIELTTEDVQEILVELGFSENNHISLSVKYDAARLWIDSRLLDARIAIGEVTKEEAYKLGQGFLKERQKLRNLAFSSGSS